MENEVKLTKLASCAGCGAKVGAGTLCNLLEGFQTHYDANLLVGYDKSDDASVYRVSDELAIVQTTDFFPPIVDDPFMYGQIAATNALSDVYAMGGEPKLALNIMCIPEKMDKATVQEILRGGYAKAYEAGAIITGEQELLDKLYVQMSTLNKYAHDVLVNYSVHACTDVTGFALLGHSLEMAQGSGVTVHLKAQAVPYHEEAYEMADMGFIPAGAYRNRDFAEAGVRVVGAVARALQDIFYDPQTSGGLLCAVPAVEAEACLVELLAVAPSTRIIGYVTEKLDSAIYLEA